MAAGAFHDDGSCKRLATQFVQGISSVKSQDRSVMMMNVALNASFSPCSTNKMFLVLIYISLRY